MPKSGSATHSFQPSSGSSLSFMVCFYATPLSTRRGVGGLGMRVDITNCAFWAKNNRKFNALCRVFRPKSCARGEISSSGERRSTRRLHHATSASGEFSKKTFRIRDKAVSHRGATSNGFELIGTPGLKRLPFCRRLKPLGVPGRGDLYRQSLPSWIPKTPGQVIYLHLNDGRELRKTGYVHGSTSSRRT